MPLDWKSRWTLWRMKSPSKTSTYSSVPASKTLTSTSGRGWRTKWWHPTIWTSLRVAHTAYSPSPCTKKIWQGTMPQLRFSASCSWWTWRVASDSHTLRMQIRCKTLCNSRRRSKSTSHSSLFVRWSRLSQKTARVKCVGPPLRSQLEAKPWWTTSRTGSPNWRQSSSRV